LALEDVPAGKGDQEGMLDDVVEGVALAEAFQCHPCGTVEPLGFVLMRGTEQAAKVARDALPEFVHHDRRHHHHASLPLAQRAPRKRVGAPVRAAFLTKCVDEAGGLAFPNLHTYRGRPRIGIAAPPKVSLRIPGD
jgi:hypothetical protein